MFFHNFKYSFITLFKNKMLIFWTFAFPLILGTFFNLAFSDIEKNDTLKVFDIALVSNEDENNKVYETIFDSLSKEGSENQLFNIEYVNLDEASSLLEKDEIVGYVIIDKDPKVVVKSNGINETILKFVTEEINNTSTILNTIVEENFNNEIDSIKDYELYYKRLYLEALQQIENAEPNINDTSSNNMSYTVIEFYTLIAMTCLYGGILGMVAINQNLANMSKNGKRVATSPSPKWLLVLSSTLASYLTQLIGILLLFIYTIFVLKVDYGTNLIHIIILTLMGSLAGLSLGIAIASTIKSDENLKTGLMVSITMVGSFLSGMMGVTLKYIVDKNIPILNLINPVNMITDGFYSLYYYDTFDRFYFNLLSLAIFSCILILISIIFLRRQKYDSI